MVTNQFGLLGLASLVIALSGCGWLGGGKTVVSSDLQREYAGSSFLDDKVQLDVAALKKDSVDFARANQDTTTQRILGRAESDIQIPAGTKLFAIIDTNCAKQNEAATWSRAALAASGQKTTLAFQAVPYEPKESTNGEVLNEAVNPDPCVLSVTRNGRRGLSTRDRHRVPYANVRARLQSRAAGVVKNQAGKQLVLNDPLNVNAGDDHLVAIRAPQAWDIFYGAEGIEATTQVKIAIIDTGVDYLHEDLVNRILKSGNQVVGYDFINDDPNPMDDDGHGTMVAGFAAAEGNNGKGFSGVMWKNALIMPVKVLGADGFGTDAQILNGIRWATDNNAEVINLSLGGDEESAAIRDLYFRQFYATTAYRGVFVSAAAGNGGEDGVGDNIDGNPKILPADFGYLYAGMMAVGSLASDTLKLSTFSNYSTTRVEISAPGETYLPDSNGNLVDMMCAPSPRDATGQSQYSCGAGTSFAAPLISGAAGLTSALLLKRRRSNEALYLEGYLTNGTVMSPDLANFVKGGRRLDLVNLIAALPAAYVPPVAPTAPPTANLTGPANAVAGVATQPYVARVTSGDNLKQWRLFLSTNPNPQWSPLSNVKETSASVPYTFNEPGQKIWKVEVEDISGRTASAQLVVTVTCPAGKIEVGSACETPAQMVAPVITQQPVNMKVLMGGTATFSVVATGSPTLTYQWRRESVNLVGQTQSTLTLSNVTAANVGRYDVLVTNGVGSAKSVDVFLTLDVPLQFTTQPQSRTVGIGRNVDIAASVSGQMPMTFQWKKQGQILTTQTTATLRITNAQPTDAGSYTLTVTNVDGTITSNPAVLTVVALPTITQQPQPQTVPLGSPASFSVTATGPGPFTYQWYRGTTLVQDSAQNTYSIPSVTMADNGATILVDVVNAGGATRSASASISISSPPSITQQPQSVAVNEAGNTAFSVVANSNSALSYQWFRDGTAIGGAVTANLNLTNVNRSQAGTYTVRVSTAGGSVTSNPAVLTVRYAPAITMQPTGTTVNVGENVTLTVAVTGVPTPTLQWSRITPDGQTVNVNGATNATLTLNGVAWGQRGVYRLRAENTVGNVTTQPIRVDIRAVNRAPSSISEGTMPVNEINRTGGFRDIENGQGL